MSPQTELISTGVPGLDHLLGGGFPALSFNIVAGDPGSGKTTLAHQILFNNATPERRALYVTVVGEPPVKMLRYQQGFDFFDQELVGEAIHYENVSEQALEGDLEGVLDAIAEGVERLEPALVVVDSFRTVAELQSGRGQEELQRFRHFVQRLSNTMTRWEATTFLLGEFDERETAVHPVFTVADGVLWLHQVREHDARVRKMEVLKLRGREELPGRHTYRISDAGIHVYPRLVPPLAPSEEWEQPADGARVRTGVEGLDRMMNGGVRTGDSVIVSGPSGSGKSVLGIHFAAAGLAAGERVVVALFEESRARWLARAGSMGLDFAEAADDGRLAVLRRQPLDLSVDESFENIRKTVEELHAERVLIDSLSGLQVAAAGSEGQRLRESIGRVVQALTEGGVTVLMTTELKQRTDELRFTPHESSFLADDIVLMRYVEIRGVLQTAISVIKMRRSGHSRAFHRYGITDRGLVVGEPLRELHGILTGVPDVEGDGIPRGEVEWTAIGEEEESRVSESEDRGEHGEENA